MMRRLIAGVGSASLLGAGAFAWARGGHTSSFDVSAARDGDAFGLHEFDYDVVVIGGGSGGLAAAKRAAANGARVALCDFVNPTKHGTTWGIGGTCVNVGCIPKKLMHTSALIHETVNHDAAHYGHETADGKPPSSIVKWETLQANAENYIRSICFGYTTDLRSKDVKYMNAFARFVEPHVIACTNKRGETTQVSARRFILAPGGRPSKMGIPGEEHAIDSDDLFRMKRDPKKTLVVGGGYIALECAGFLHGIGRSATCMMRSVPLKAMDRDMIDGMVKYMRDSGMELHEYTLPSEITKLGDGRLSVKYTHLQSKEEKTEVYDTVLMAVGRDAQVKGMDLENAGVKLHGHGKIEVDKYNRTTAPHIYALGDAIRGGLELTPVAIKAGNALADRLYRDGKELSDMRGVPTTVFTPLEYSFVGLSEQEAAAELGDDVEVYLKQFQPLEWTVPHRPSAACRMSLIVQRSTDKVVGFHILSPNAGEITQGVAVALKAGATKAHFDDTVGIHPTIAETMNQLTITRSSGESPAAGGGC
jgi:thioredoxin reductase (NADPH)